LRTDLDAKLAVSSCGDIEPVSFQIVQNNKAKVVIRKSYGFKTSDMLKISLYHKLGKLPVPELAHEYF
jgi:hypothetical protein